MKNYNIMSLISHINNAVIKFPIYFTKVQMHMYIVRKIINITA